MSDVKKTGQNPRRASTPPPSRATEPPASFEESAVDHSVPVADFEPLSESYRQSLDDLAKVQRGYVLSRCREFTPSDAAAVDRGALNAWRSGLDAARVGAYCAATSTYLTKVLLDASTPNESAMVRLEEPAHGLPHVEVFIVQGSRTARLRGRPATAVYYSLDDMALGVATAAGLDLDGVRVWCLALMACLDPLSAFLPGLSVRPENGAWRVERSDRFE